ncbi:hypothetical protein FIBSPDRAFT_872739 [Athelia psychrophila]|uniref:Uncharacterized protein n=1 Tax=Athelia psychrophila TaxID=1759441 RepID=A0A165Z9Z4_9AGAM|nr:hypothetical protein FIBSPDRAFT_872739 [Fibularhizoctonia sp. CBS 109695]
MCRHRLRARSTPARPPVPGWQGGKQERGATGQGVNPPGEASADCPRSLDPLRLAFALPAELVVILRWPGKNDTTRRALEALKMYEVEAGAAGRIHYAVRARVPVWVEHPHPAPLLLLHPSKRICLAVTLHAITLPLLAEEAPPFVLGA